VDPTYAFRRGNEAIARTAARAGERERTIDFICECADEECFAAVSLTLDEYQEHRNRGRGPLAAPGHEVPRASRTG
jgi:hypothetical protein